MAQPNPLVLNFDVYLGETLVKSVRHSVDSITIGSGDAALLVVKHPSVAELHAVINVEAGKVLLFDLGSPAGTRLNGAAVSSTAVAIQPGSTLEIGEVKVVVDFSSNASFQDEEATHVGRAPSFEDDKTDPHAIGATPPKAPQGDQEESEDHEGDDVMSLLIRSVSDPGAKGAAKVLQVSQIWGDALLEEKTFSAGHSVQFGSEKHHVWRVLGARIAPVPDPIAPIAASVPPWAASCDSEWKQDFFVSPESIQGKLSYNFVTPSPQGFVVNAESSWDGFADVGEQRYTFDQLVAAGKATKTANGYQIPVVDDTRVAVEVGGMVFFVRRGTQGKKAVGVFSIDWLYLAALSVFLLFGGVMGLWLSLREYRPETQTQTDEDRFVELMMNKPPPEPPKPKGGNPDAGEGEKAKGEEGKVGQKDAKMEKAKGDKVLSKKMIDKEIVDRAGLMGALADDSMASLGSAGLSGDIQGGIGGLIGASGTQMGSGGLGSRGGGLGGGGNAEGLGGLGTKGGGRGGSGYGSGGGDIGKKGEGGIGKPGGDVFVIGGLDRSLIDEVIKRHMNQIRYCYQRELMKNNSLAGKIVIKFTIAKDGSVSSASTKSSSMNNNAVESCIESRFMKMEFPQPKGGGVVIVSYPFLFSPG